MCDGKSNVDVFQYFCYLVQQCLIFKNNIIIIKELEFIIFLLLLQKNCSTCIINDDFDICGKVKFFCFLIA